MNYLLRILFVSVLFIQYSFGQNISGKIFDAETKEPLAFANFIFNNNQKFYTSSDIDGRFSFTSTQELTALTVTYIGYEMQTVKLQKDKNITIYLKSSADALDEVVIKPGENPANAIIRKVIANKEKNNPENISTFKYTSYNKTVYDMKTDGKTKTDSINKKAKGKLLKDSPLFMMESVSERKFIGPDISEEVVIGTKVSGFQNPSFASLATDLQPFSFYKDNIKLFDIQYLNPISKGSLNKYRFTLEDTLFQKNDTIYIISFEPRKNKNIEGLKGSLYINSNKYAVQNVIASPFEKGKIEIKIQQQYTFVDNKYWFPEQLNYALLFPDLKMAVDGRSYISEVQLNIPLRKKEFALEAVRIDKMATRQDTLFWDKHRIEKLSSAEKVTYRVVDSIGKENNFDRLLTTMEKLTQFKIGIGVFDLDLAKTLVYNKYEGYRLGLGVYT
ncbi:MAG: carboxypeptidase-like regulatory domain-containing protein, partial [Flavobacterium sp.]